MCVAKQQYLSKADSMSNSAVLNWTFYTSAIFIVFGLIGIFAPLDEERLVRQVNLTGTILLALGLLVFLVGLALTKGF